MFKRCLTASLFVAFSGVSFAQLREPEAIKYLQHRQTENGGFAPSARDAKPTLGATSSAIRALKYFGGTVSNVEGAKKFVASCFDKETGGFRPMPDEGKPDAFTTAVGIMAVVELKMPMAEYEKPVIAFFEKNAKSFEEIRIAAAGLEAMGKSSSKTQEWLKTLAETRNEDGTYGKDAELTRATGGAVACQLRLGEKVKDAKVIANVMKSGQRQDGGFAKAGARTSDLETTYRVMRAFVMLKEQPNVPKLRNFIDSCRNDDGGFGVVPEAPSTVSGTYYAAILRYWVK